MAARTTRWPIVLAYGMLILALLACGGFQVRVTPTAVPPEAAQPTAAPTATPARPTATPAPAATPTAPSPTATPTAQPAGLMKVVALGGVNVREQPGAKAKAVGRFNANAIVTVIEGPTTADGYTWWKVTAAALSGWVAAGPADDPWLIPTTAIEAPAGEPAVQPTSAPRLVERAIKPGDRVQVTTDPAQVLTIRDYAGTNTTPVAKVRQGAIFTVRSGPVKQNGLTWWELEGNNIKGWAAEGNGTDRWLTPLE